MSKTVRDRIIQAWEESGVSAAELSRRSGVSYDVITKLKHRPTSSTSAENAEKLLRALGLTGTASTSLATPPTAFGNSAPSDAALTSVPVYDIAAAAGVGMIVPDYEAVAENLAFPSGYLRHLTTTAPQHLAIISVTGASMLPTLSHDDLVMVDTTKKNIAYDGMFVIRHDDLLKVKRLRWGRGKTSIIIRSDNVRDFPEEDADPMDIEIVGRVIWTGKKEP
ncbi:S24 family peptidase [Vannielia litorea]|uniref:S24 family peptidase n=1 Tax=Vannielia litorea TaxID=1217970 RepID=UPI001BCEB00F|nr:S24 family peptidase [Vannielia litorea]